MIIIMNGTAAFSPNQLGADSADGFVQEAAQA
jgi:hypothetical protein